jgi:hypothetical protein
MIPVDPEFMHRKIQHHGDSRSQKLRSQIMLDPRQGEIVIEQP